MNTHRIINFYQSRFCAKVLNDIDFSQNQFFLPEICAYIQLHINHLLFCRIVE